MTPRTLALIIATTALGCGSPAQPASPAATTLPLQGQTATFDFYYAPSDTVDATWQEAYHAWATAALGVSPSRRIGYHKYLSRDHMGQVTGQFGTNAYADRDRFEIHTLWGRDNHETVHLYSSVWGSPVALWTEGLAVAFQRDPVAGDLVPRWNRVALHDHARQFLAQSRLIPIADLLATSDFRRFDSNVTYPEAGSFMQFLLETCGLDSIKRLYASGSASDTAASVRAQFTTACGRTVDAAEADWRQMLAR